MSTDRIITMLGVLLALSIMQFVYLGFVGSQLKGLNDRLDQGFQIEIKIPASQDEVPVEIKPQGDNVA